MSKKDELTVMELWKETLRKVIPWAIIALIGAFSKASYDVYAFSQTKSLITKKLKSHDESILHFGSAIDSKADRAELNKVEKKIDKVLTILCTMNNNKPTDCAR